MKKKFLRISFLQIALVLFISPIYAEKIESNGIYYNVTSSNTVEVTNRGDAEDDWMYYAPNDLYSGIVVIPSTIEYNNNTYNVTAIGDNAFAGSQYLSVLDISSSINSIGDGAFTLCNALQSISVEDGNTSFFSEEGILYAKNPIAIYYVPRGIQGDIVLNESITKIPSSAFQYCSKITTIQLPDNVVSIGDGAFNSCTGLKEIFFNNKIESIGVQAFSKCSAMEIITIPECVKIIGASAFVDCSNLQFVLLKEGLQTIDKYAFYNCGNIGAISLPSTLQSIGEKAFDECISLATIQNNSSLYLVQGAETNGCVAKYATSIINEEPEQPQIIGFEYIIPNSCHNDYDYDVTGTYSYRIENGNLILYGIVVRICEGTIETAEIVDLGETIKIPTYSTEIGPASDCICAFDFEITIPNFNRDYCVIEFDKQQIIVDTKSNVGDEINNLVCLYYNTDESQIYVEFSKCDIYDIELYSSQGQLISSKKIEGQSVQLTVPTNTGIYFVQIRHSGELLKTSRFYRK